MRIRSQVQSGWACVPGLYGGFAVVAHSPCSMLNAFAARFQVLAEHDT